MSIGRNIGQLKAVVVWGAMLSLCLTGWAQTHVQFNFTDPAFGISQTTNRYVVLQAETGTQLTQANQLLPFRLTGYTDTNGSITFSNLFGSSISGYYHWTVPAPPQMAQGDIWVPSTNLGLVSASLLQGNFGNSTFPAAAFSWSAATADLRYGPSTNAVTNFVTLGLLNLTSNALFVTITNSTNGLASIPYVTNAIGVATNTVTTNLTALLVLDLSQKLNTNGYFAGTANYSVLTNPPAIPSTNGLASQQYVQQQTTTVWTATLAQGAALTNLINTTGANGTNLITTTSNALQSEISGTTASSTNSWSLNGTTIATPTSTLGTSNKVALVLVAGGVQALYLGTNENVNMAGGVINNGAQNSFAEGYFASAPGNASAAFNGDTIASGGLSFACGDSSRAEGLDAFTCGDGTDARDFSFAAGVNAFATTNSFAWADNTQPVGYLQNRRTNTFSIFSQNGVQINATNGFTNALFVNGTIYATTNIYINGSPVLTNGTAAGVAAGTLITASTNAGVVTINAVNQTNGYTSIVFSNAANFLATNGSASGLSGLPTVAAGALATVATNGTIYTVAAVSQTNTIAANSLTGTVTNAINSPLIQVGGNVNFTASTNILRVLGAGAGAVLNGTMSLVSASLYTNAGTTIYYTNNAANTWTLFYTNAAQFVSSTGVTNVTLTPVGSGSCAVFFGDAFQTDGVLFQGQITNRWQQVFYGAFNSPVGNVAAFPPAVYYKTGAGSIWEKTNTTYDASGWDCVITNRPGT